jgi:hypothetical protein
VHSSYRSIKDPRIIIMINNSSPGIHKLGLRLNKINKKHYFEESLFFKEILNSVAGICLLRKKIYVPTIQTFMIQLTINENRVSI